MDCVLSVCNVFSLHRIDFVSGKVRVLAPLLAIIEIIIIITIIIAIIQIIIIIITLAIIPQNFQNI